MIYLFTLISINSVEIDFISIPTKQNYKFNFNNTKNGLPVFK